jgi:glutamate racemase
MTISDSRPIGVFDSGIGGLTVLKELAHQFPHENFLYLGDTARLPYGSKSPQTIRKYSEQNIHFLQKQNVKAIVIACNTASSQVPEKELLETPIYNVIEPGSLRALQLSNSKKIGLVATRATVQSQAYTKRIHSLEPKAEVFAQAAPLFVPLAEEGWDSDPITNLIVFRYLKPLLDENIDTLILGCTHYPLVKEKIESILKLKTLYPDPYVAGRVKELTVKPHEVLEANTSETFNFYSSSKPEWVKKSRKDFIYPFKK